LSDERVADKYRVDGEMEYRYNYFTEAGPYSAYFQDAIIQKLNTVLSDENQLALDNSEDVQFLADIYTAKTWGFIQKINPTDYSTHYQNILSELRTSEIRKMFGNIFQWAIQDLLATEHFNLNEINRDGILFNGNSASMFYLDLTNKALQPFILHDQAPTPKDEVGVFVSKKYYQSLKGKSQITILKRNEIKIKTKVIGWFEFPNNQSVRYMNDIVIDNTDLFDYYDTNNLFSEYIQTSGAKFNLTTRDSDYSKPVFDQANQILKSQSAWYKPGTTQFLTGFDASIFKIAFSKQDLGLPNLLVTISIVFDALFTILSIVTFYFFLQQIVKNDRKALWFLKAMGTKRMKLAWLVVNILIYPILFSLAIAFIGQAVVQNQLYNFISNDYLFEIGFWKTNYFVFIMIGIIFLAIILIFFVILYSTLSAKNLNNNQVYAFGLTERVAITCSSGLKKTFRIKNSLWFSFSNHNVAKNIVTYLILLITMTITLFSYAFNGSVAKSAKKISHFADPYQNYSIMAPEMFKLYTDDNVVFQKFNSVTSDKPSEKQIDFVFSPDESQIEKINYNRETYTTALPDLMQVFSNLEGAWISADDLKVLAHHDFSLQFGDFDLTSVLGNLEVKVEAFQNKFPNYQGPGISFYNTYIPQEDIATVALSTTQEFSEVESFGSRIIAVTDEMRQKIKQFGNYVIAPTTDLYDASMKMNAPHDYNSLIARTAELGYYLDQHPGEFSDDQQLFKFKVPIIDVIAGSSYKNHLGQMKKTALGSFYNMESREFESDDTYVYNAGNIPVYFRISKIDYTNPNVSDVYVDEHQLRTVLQKTMEMSKIGTEFTTHFDAPTITEHYRKFNTGMQKFAEYFASRVMDDNVWNAMRNTVYDNDAVPFVLNNFTIATSETDHNTITSYQKYMSKIYNENFVAENPQLIYQTFTQKTATITFMFDLINIVFIVLVVLISLILIYLVLKENENIVRVLKTLGYRTREIINYLIFGYLVATILATITAVGITILLLHWADGFVFSSFNFNLAVTFGWKAITALVVVPVFNLMIILLSIMIYDTKLKVSSVDQFA
jgi:hypothetical protein